MSARCILGCTIFLLVVASVPMLPWSAGSNAAEPAAKPGDVEVTPSLTREIQFMLLRLGMDPGPIDGVIGPQTARAWRKFQQDSRLPQMDLVNGGRMPASVLARLRSEASRAIFESEKKPEPSASPPTPPTAATAPPAPVAPAPAPAKPDRFAVCRFNVEDFRIGSTQYTPEKYLEEGFGGSTARAVAMLNDRLNEARQIAGNIGGAALTEVQRQSRVLDYFNCRLKIEQASK